MNTTRRRTGVTAILVSLPVLSNVASFVIFFPLFVPGRTATSADFQRAGIVLGIVVLAIELLALLLVARLLRGEGVSLKSLVSFQRGKLRTYVITGLIALLPTLAIGWLYSRGQTQAGVESNLSQLSQGEVMFWYLLLPVAAAFLEESIWRAYALPRISGAWRGLILTSLSFALFHGIFNPFALVAAFLQGLVWGWAYQRTESTIPSMALHFLSRYLALIPGFG